MTAIGPLKRNRQDRSVAQHLGDGASSAAGANATWSKLFAVVGGAVSVLAVVLYGTLRGSWLDAVLAGIALGMSMLPEEFPVVLAVFMAMGAWRISQARVLTRRAAAIETLGAATVLCTDKTGTLTENRMAIAELRLMDGKVFRPTDVHDASLPAVFHDLVEFGLLASAARTVRSDGQGLSRTQPRSSCGDGASARSGLEARARLRTARRPPRRVPGLAGCARQARICRCIEGCSRSHCRAFAVSPRRIARR